MNKYMTYAISSALLGWLFLIPTSATAQVSFPDALETHVEAVVAHDLDALIPTLTSGEELTMITPEGQRLETKEQYVDFHRRWFTVEDPQEELDFEIEHIIESPTLSHALLQIHYTHTGPEGDLQTYVGWLALTFALEDQQWRLVFDQNTGIMEGSEDQ